MIVDNHTSMCQSNKGKLLYLGKWVLFVILEKFFDPFLLSMALLQNRATFYIEKSMEKALLLKIVKYG